MIQLMWIWSLTSKIGHEILLLPIFTYGGGDRHRHSKPLPWLFSNPLDHRLLQIILARLLSF